VVGGLLLEQPDNHRPAGVVDAFRQPRPGQPRHGEIFHGDRLVLAEQPQGELVVLVGPPVADPAMSNRDPVAGLGPVRRAITFSAELPLDAGEATLGRTQVSRIGDRLGAAVTGDDRREHAQAKVDPGDPVDWRQRDRGALDHERGVVTPVRVADDCDAGGRRRQRTGPAHPQLAYLSDVKPTALAHAEPVSREPYRLAAALGAEPGLPDSAALARAG
jgi:hypothetical protein